MGNFIFVAQSCPLELAGPLTTCHAVHTACIVPVAPTAEAAQLVLPHLPAQLTTLQLSKETDLSSYFLNRVAGSAGRQGRPTWATSVTSTMRTMLATYFTQ